MRHLAASPCHQLVAATRAGSGQGGAGSARGSLGAGPSLTSAQTATMALVRSHRRSSRARAPHRRQIRPPPATFHHPWFRSGHRCLCARLTNVKKSSSATILVGPSACAEELSLAAERDRGGRRLKRRRLCRSLSGGAGLKPMGTAVTTLENITVTLGRLLFVWESNYRLLFSPPQLSFLLPVKFFMLFWSYLPANWINLILHES
jgi:hypothetical protein